MGVTNVLCRAVRDEGGAAHPAACRRAAKGPTLPLSRTARRARPARVAGSVPGQSRVRQHSKPPSKDLLRDGGAERF
eukprot:4282461-Prymnesium_polylepis.1